VRDRYIDTSAAASTAVQVVKLRGAGFLFEIEAIAVVPESSYCLVPANAGTQAGFRLRGNERDMRFNGRPL
jgi:hypothetical protein